MKYRILVGAILLGLNGPFLLHASKLRTDQEGQPEIVKNEKEVRLGPNSRLILVEDSNMINQFKLNNELARNRFEEAVLAFTEKPNLQEAWKSLVHSSDRVGIKINTKGSTVFQSKPVFVDSVVSGLLSAGVAKENITIWDDSQDELKAAGWRVDGVPARGARVSSVVPGTGYDAEQFLFHEVVGRLIWGDHDFVGKKSPPLDIGNLKKGIEDKEESVSKKKQQVSNRSYFANIVSKNTDKIINLAVMSDHPTLGLWGCLSSLALCSIDNNRRFNSPKKFAARAVAEILTNEVLKDKVVLHVLDGTIMQFAGGPDFVANYAESLGLIMVGQDAVAMDSMVRKRIEKARQARSVVPLSGNALHIEACESFGLGTTTEAEIELVLLP
ncbi:MAG: DUF362 domain-containing protein [Verrucomicrobiota bacterium]